MKVLITGGAKGIGMGIARRMVESNKVAKLVITSRTQDQLKKGFEELEGQKQTTLVEGRVLEYLSEESRKEFLDSLNDVFDVIFLNSGYAINGSLFNETVYNQTLGINYHSTVWLAEQLLQNKKLKEGGRMIITSSTVGVLSRLKNNPSIQSELKTYQSGLEFERFKEIVALCGVEIFDYKKAN